jgi:hypothetical protein
LAWFFYNVLPPQKYLLLRQCALMCFHVHLVRVEAVLQPVNEKLPHLRNHRTPELVDIFDVRQ